MTEHRETHVGHLLQKFEVPLLKFGRRKTPHQADVGQQEAEYEANTFGAPVGAIFTVASEGRMREYTFSKIVAPPSSRTIRSREGLSLFTEKQAFDKTTSFTKQNGNVVVEDL
jgi:hypothetical protein